MPANDGDGSGGGKALLYFGLSGMSTTAAEDGIDMVMTAFDKDGAGYWSIPGLVVTPYDTTLHTCICCVHPPPPCT